MSKHTPGPWEVIDRRIDGDGDAVPKYILGGVMDIQICLMESQVVSNAILFEPTWSKFANSEMQNANARLIAAAPELLEALIDIERTAGIAASESDPVRVRARAAIAKATGETA